MSTSVIVWIGALLSLCVYSFLFWSDNPLFSIAEALVVGASTGYYVGVGFKTLKDLAFRPFAAGKFLLIVPIILGMLLFSRFSKKIAWLSRIPVSMLVGMASGVSVSGVVQSDILTQVKATIVAPMTLTKLAVFVGVVGVIRYFFLTREADNPVERGLCTLGRWTMMGGFGAAFAAAVHGRFSILIGHCQFLLFTWLGLGR